MNSNDELGHMLMRFKVQDLQLLLGFAGQNKNGRKHDLLRRALNLIHNKLSTPIEVKIRQIYRRMVLEEAALFQPSLHRSFNNGTDQYAYSNMSSFGCDYAYHPYYAYDFGSGSHSYYDPVYLRNKEDVYAAPFYPQPSSAPLNLTPVPLQQSPKVEIPAVTAVAYKSPISDLRKLTNITFKRLSFFRYNSDVVTTTPTVPKLRGSDTYEFALSFTLDSQQQARTILSKKYHKDARYQLQLRMCKLDENMDLNTSREVYDDLPLALGVKLNDKNCQLPPVIPSTNKPGMLLKRMNAPINLTPLMRRNHVNNLIVSWSVECGSLYGLAVHLVEKFSSEDLINQLKAKGERPAKQTEKYVRDKLDELCDDDISATSLKISLICPLGKIKMSLPVRATSCNHLQCFDGCLYVMMNEVKSVWQCPVCNQTCRYEDLFIDGYFMQMLRNEKLANATDVQINADGSVEPVIPKKRKNMSDESSLKKSKTKIGSSSTNDVNSCSSTSNTSFIAPLTESKIEPGDVEPLSSSTPPLKNATMVDLTESDSERVDTGCNLEPLNLKKTTMIINHTFVGSETEETSSEKKLPPPVYDIDD